MSIFSGNADLFHNDQKEMEKRVCGYHAVIKDYHDDNADERRAGARRASQFSVRPRQPCLLWRNLCNPLFPGLALEIQNYDFLGASAQSPRRKHHHVLLDQVRFAHRLPHLPRAALQLLPFLYAFFCCLTRSFLFMKYHIHRWPLCNL